MRSRVVVSFLVSGLVLAGSVLLPADTTRQSPPIVLRNVTIIDGLGSPPRAGTTIVIRDGRIAALSQDDEAQIPPGAATPDVAGKFVIPGLIDAHVHLATTERPPALLTALMQATLLGGVTTVRDMGGNGAVLAELVKAANAPGAQSPSIHTSVVFAGPGAFWFTDARARYLANNQPPGSTPWLVQVDRSTNIRDAVARAKAFGVTGVKIYSHLTRSQVHAIANEARRQGLQVWSHATIIPAGPRDAVDARPATISHADYLVWQGRTGVAPDLFGHPRSMLAAMNAVPPTAPTIGDLLRRMRDRQVMLEPTLYIGVQAAGFASDEDRTRIDQQVAYGAAVTELAHKAGVPIVAGTDALGGSTPNLHVELQLLVKRAGLAPLEAIRAATSNAARALGRQAEIGSIVVGRRADLVVLDRNPADDIRNTQTVVLVLRDGVVHRRVIPMSIGPYGEAPPTP